MSSPIRASALLFRHTDTQQRLGGLRDRLAEVQGQAASGLRVSEISDAPSRLATIHRLAESIDDQAVFADNAKSAKSVLGMVDTSLAEASTTMKRARELAVRFANGIFDGDARATAADEVDALRNTMIKLGNSEFGGRYVFAGTAYDSPAFDATGAYVGSGDLPSAVVSAHGDTVPAGADGQAIFASSLTALTDLADALRTGGADDVQAEIAALDGALDDVVRGRAEVGAEFNRADDVVQLADRLSITLNEGLNREVAADPLETYQHFTELAQHMEATLQLTARSNGMQGLFARI